MYADVIIILLVLYGLKKGFQNGIIIEISNIISVFLAIYIGVHFSEFIYPYLSLEGLNNYSNIIPLIAFLIVFIIILIIVKSIGELIHRISNQLALGLISRVLGAIFGMMKLLLLCVFLLSISTSLNLMDISKQQKSMLLRPLKKVSKVVLPEITKHKKIIMEATKENIEKAKDSLEKKINPE